MICGEFLFKFWSNSSVITATIWWLLAVWLAGELLQCLIISIVFTSVSYCCSESNVSGDPVDKFSTEVSVSVSVCICGGPKLEKCPTDMKTALKLPALQLTEQTGKGQSVGQSDRYLLHRSDLRVIDLLSLWRGGVDGLKVLPKGVEEKGKGGNRGKGEAKRRVKDREESRK